jgi:hypothetical protein
MSYLLMELTQLKGKPNCMGFIFWSQPSYKLFATKLQLDFLSHVIWLPFQVCQLYISKCIVNIKIHKPCQMG